MARRRVAEKREILPDPKYKQELVAKFINCMMLDGKKSCAEKAFYGALDLIEKRGLEGFETPLQLFETAVENAKPVLEVKSRRVGGSNYQIPIEVKPDRRRALAIRWLIGFARKRTGRSIMEKLSAELTDAAYRRGATIKKKEEVHKMAEANKAFAHYRW